MTKPPYDRSAFGVTVRSTMIYERTLELAHKLVWNSKDLGLSRVSDPRLRVRGGSKREKDVSEAGYVFDWLDPIKRYSGVARQHYLRDEHWCNREQVINILLDTAMQAYREDSRNLLCALTGADFSNSDLVKLEITNHPRRYTGAPDSAFIDLESRTIALVEIKIGKSTTKYSVEQSVKYETLSALLRSAHFFPNFRVYSMLLCPSESFSKNTDKAHLLGPSSDSQGRVSFAYDAKALAAFNPTGHTEISKLVAGRVRQLAKGNITIPELSDPVGICFFSWRGVERVCRVGLLRENITALMRYLAPDPAP